MSIMLLIPVISVCSNPLFLDVLLEDNFSDGNSDGWNELEYGNCSYEVVDGEYWFSGSVSSWGLSFTGDSAGTMTVPDYSMLVRVEPEFCGYAGPLVRYSGIDSYFAGLILMPESNCIYLYDLNLSAGSNIIDYCSFSIDPEESYWIRLEVEGAECRGRVWTGEVGAEPSGWQVCGTDTLVNSTGGIGIYSYSAYTLNMPGITHSVYFDDVMVNGELIGSMEPLTWGKLKSSFAE